MSEFYHVKPAHSIEHVLSQHPDMRRAWERHVPPQYAGKEWLAWVEFHHQGPFTTCLLGLPADNRSRLVIGTAKQNRYAHTADAYDALRGETIALSRALQNAQQVQP